MTPEGQSIKVSATLGGKPFEIHLSARSSRPGFRPDLPMLRELRIEVDPAIEAPPPRR